MKENNKSARAIKNASAVSAVKGKGGAKRATRHVDPCDDPIDLDNAGNMELDRKKIVSNVNNAMVAKVAKKIDNRKNDHQIDLEADADADADADVAHPSPPTLNSEYLILIKIGEGSFGTVWRVTQQKTKKDYAAKFELKNEKSRLRHEYLIYKNLIEGGVDKGIPKIKRYFETNKNYCLIMQLLGKNLEQIMHEYKKEYDIGSILKLGIELTELLKKIHNAGYIHRDIKPNNFLIGTGKHINEVYIMDFGLSKKYTKANGSHMNFSSDRSMVGTVRYASLNLHHGIEPSRRDDLESIGYMLIYLIKGRLPWQGLKRRDDIDQSKMIGNYKRKTSLKELCDELPPCFEEYIKYCRNLRFDQDPDYAYLTSLFIKTSIELKVNIQYWWEKDGFDEDE